MRGTQNTEQTSADMKLSVKVELWVKLLPVWLQFFSTAEEATLSLFTLTLDFY